MSLFSAAHRLVMGASDDALVRTFTRDANEIRWTVVDGDTYLSLNYFAIDSGSQAPARFLEAFKQWLTRVLDDGREELEIVGPVRVVQASHITAAFFARERPHYPGLVEPAQPFLAAAYHATDMAVQHGRIDK